MTTGSGLRRWSEPATAAFVTAGALLLVETTGGALDAGWAIVAFLDAWLYVFIVPRLMRPLGRGEFRSVMRVAPSSLAELVAAALTSLPGIAVIVDARSSTRWHLVYLILGLAGWWLLQLREPASRANQAS